jgi:hypothetical protein
LLFYLGIDPEIFLRENPWPAPLCQFLGIFALKGSVTLPPFKATPTKQRAAGPFNDGSATLMMIVSMRPGKKHIPLPFPRISTR